MADAYFGQIMPWPINYAPRNWAFCQGQTLQIAQYSALYALLGTTYGGDGVTNFRLPDLRGRLVVGVGQGAWLTPYYLGNMAGYEKVLLDTNNLPEHTHPTPASTTGANSGTPAANVALANSSNKLYASQINTSLAPAGSNTTSHQPVDRRQPLLALNYIICVNGLWPPRD